MIEFARFETFDPDGPGLGNLFGRLSPLLALGVWPSGDFRVEPGGGFAPAIAFYAGAALAIAALGLGLRAWLRRGETVLPAALLAAALLWLYSLTAGTPYQEAKALAIAAPLVALIAVRGLTLAGPRWLGAAYAAAALASSGLVLANGPVGPAVYSPALADLRSDLGAGSVLVVGPGGLMRSEHGRDYLVWELRGNRLCVVEAATGEPDAPWTGASLVGISQVLVVDDVGARGGAPPTRPPPGFELARSGPGYVLFEAAEEPGADGPCPFVADGQRADPGQAGG